MPAAKLVASNEIGLVSNLHAGPSAAEAGHKAELSTSRASQTCFAVITSRPKVFGEDFMSQKPSVKHAFQPLQKAALKRGLRGSQATFKADQLRDALGIYTGATYGGGTGAVTGGAMGAIDTGATLSAG